MGFQQSFSDSFGAVNASAYYNIISINIDHRFENALITLATYRDKLSRDTGVDNPVQTIHFYIGKVIVLANSTEGVEAVPAFSTLFGNAVLDVANENPRKQCYEYIRTRTAYVGAIDVYE